MAQHGNPLEFFSGDSDWERRVARGWCISRCGLSPAGALPWFQLLLMVGEERSLCAACPG